MRNTLLKRIAAGAFAGVFAFLSMQTGFTYALDEVSLIEEEAVEAASETEEVPLWPELPEESDPEEAEELIGASDEKAPTVSDMELTVTDGDIVVAMYGNVYEDTEISAQALDPSEYDGMLNVEGHSEYTHPLHAYDLGLMSQNAVFEPFEIGSELDIRISGVSFNEDILRIRVDNIIEDSMNLVYTFAPGDEIRFTTDKIGTIVISEVTAREDELKEYVFSHQTLEMVSDNTTIGITGDIPEGVTASVVPVDTEELQHYTDELHIVKAWDIRLIDADGEEFQPERYGKSVEVTFSDFSDVEPAEVSVVHLNTEYDVDVLSESFTVSETESVTVEADSFSVYGIGTAFATSSMTVDGYVNVPLVNKTGALYHIKLTTAQGSSEAFCLDHGKAAKSGDSFFYSGRFVSQFTDVQEAETIKKIVAAYSANNNGDDYNLSYKEAQCLIWGAQEGYTEIEDMKAILAELGASEENQNAVAAHIYNITEEEYNEVHEWKNVAGGPSEGYQRFVMPVGSTTLIDNNGAGREHTFSVRLFKGMKPLVTDVFYGDRANSSTYNGGYHARYYPTSISENGVYTFDLSQIPGWNTSSYSLYGSDFGIYVRRFLNTDEYYNSSPDPYYGHEFWASDDGTPVPVERYQLLDMYYFPDETDINTAEYDEDSELFDNPAAKQIYKCSVRVFARREVPSNTMPMVCVHTSSAGTFWDYDDYPYVSDTTTLLNSPPTLVGFVSPITAYTLDGERVGDLYGTSSFYRSRYDLIPYRTTNLIRCYNLATYYVKDDHSTIYDLMYIGDMGYLEDAEVLPESGGLLSYKTHGDPGKFRDTLRFIGFTNRDRSQIFYFLEKFKAYGEASGYSSATELSSSDSEEYDSIMTFDWADISDKFSGEARVYLAERGDYNRETAKLKIRIIKDGEGLTGQDVALSTDPTYRYWLRDRMISPSDIDGNGVYTFALSALSSSDASTFHIYINGEDYSNYDKYVFLDDSDAFDETCMSVSMPVNSDYWNPDNPKRKLLSDMTSFIDGSYAGDPVSRDANGDYNLIFMLSSPAAVTLDKGGGSGGTNTYYTMNGNAYPSESSKAGSEITSIIPPTKQHATFDGYYTEADGKGTKVIEPDGSLSAKAREFTEAVTLYAHYLDYVVYTVTLENRHTGGTAKYYLYEGDAYPSSAVTGKIDSITIPTWTEASALHTFLGYFTEENGAGTKAVDESGTILEEGKGFTSDMTLYAHWSTKTFYHVRLNNRFEDTEHYSTPEYWVSEGMAYTEPSDDSTVLNSIILPSRDGYIFLGYYRDQSPEEGIPPEIDDLGDGFDNTKSYTSNVNLYALWERMETVPVKLDNNGANVISGTRRYFVYDGTAYSTNAIIASNEINSVEVPTRTGFTFEGFYTLAASGDRVIDEKGLISDTGKAYTTETTLYAHWTPMPYATITLDKNGGSRDGTKRYYNLAGQQYLTSNFMNVCTDGKLPALPYKPYSEFLGFFTDPSGGTEVISREGILSATAKGYTKDTTLYAHYSDASYTVRFEDHDGRLISEGTYIRGAEIVIPDDPEPYYDEDMQYIFSRWTPSVTKTALKDVTYTAVYKGINILCTVTFLNSLKAAPDNVISKKDYYIGEDIEVPEYGKDFTSEDTQDFSYTFTGWTPSVSNIAQKSVTYITRYKMTPKLSDQVSVEFVNDDNSTISRAVYQKGDVVSVPVYGVDFPKKEDTKDYTYEFRGWSPSVSATAVKNVVYTAVYIGKIKPEYTVTFLNDDGTEISKKVYKEGETVDVPVCGIDFPFKDDDDTRSYSFLNWTPSVREHADRAMTYTAVYKTGLKKVYTITFLDRNGEVISERTYNGGEEIYVPPAPSDYTEDGYTYTFKGWSPSLSATAEKTVIYRPQYTKTALRTYTVSFVSNGKTISSRVYNSGEELIVPADPSDYSDGSFDYTFSSWNPALQKTVTKNAVYTARFTRKAIRQYTVTFKDDDGTILKTVTASYGDTVTAPVPSKEDDDNYSYEFNGWSPTFNETVTKNVVYTARYKRTALRDQRQYTVTFRNWDGSTIRSDTYSYGDTLNYPSDPSRPADAGYTYTFSGWSPSVASSVTRNAVYTAQYRRTANSGGNSGGGSTSGSGTVPMPTQTPSGGTAPVPAKPADPENTNTAYTISFVNWDGAVISTRSYYKGESIVIPGNPERADDTFYRYSFSGWKPTVSTTAQRNATYTAQYKKERIGGISDENRDPNPVPRAGGASTSDPSATQDPASGPAFAYGNGNGSEDGTEARNHEGDASEGAAANDLMGYEQENLLKRNSAENDDEWLTLNQTSLTKIVTEAEADEDFLTITKTKKKDTRVQTIAGAVLAGIAGIGIILGGIYGHLWLLLLNLLFLKKRKTFHGILTDEDSRFVKIIVPDPNMDYDLVQKEIDKAKKEGNNVMSLLQSLKDSGCKTILPYNTKMTVQFVRDDKDMDMLEEPEELNADEDKLYQMLSENEDSGLKAVVDIYSPKSDVFNIRLTY